LYLIFIAKNCLGETLLRLPLMLDSRLRVNLQRGSAVGVALVIWRLIDQTSPLPSAFLGRSNV
jgi:hypothetical protein